MQNVVEVPCASMRVRFLVCARVWECARARACMRVCAHTIPSFVFVCVCASVRLYEGASRLAGQRSTARRDP